MSLAMTLAMRGLSLLGVLLAVLVLLVVVLGATGFSDGILKAVVNEDIRAMRTGLAQTIRDPDDLEFALDAQRAELERFYGLDEPWYQRLPDMVRRVITLDLGEARTLRTFEGSAHVLSLVMERLPYTVLLLTSSMAITAVLGLLIGVKLATMVGSKLDRIVSYASAVSYALPAWWAGILLILLLAFQLRWLPAGGLYSSPPPEAGLERFLDLLWHAVLPVLTLVIVSLGSWTYTVRTMVLNTAQEFFVTVARAKGLPEGQVMRRYILRVAAPPIATNLVLGLAASLGGAILTETVFNWPGMGRLYYEAILGADESVIVALTFMFTLLYVAARFLLEVLYIVLDPRIRYSER
ncbi:MAG: peptide/nickel transport system permease protein [Chloroflexi bacterium]|jgi:peptide/nickel transport system permease protein|nr:MAG: peptide/nickel transport system permease protein [Chloroflexota bacterium]